MSIKLTTWMMKFNKWKKSSFYSVFLPRTMKIVQPGSFEADKHRYPQVLNAKAHPLIEYFFSLTPERIAARYCHLHPFVDQEDILKRLRYKAKHFHLA